ncbi:MAG: GNAT family N-acetyltransferase, partial [Acidimicrobiia bacterium]|nr:GNAT family N-acetyltransferase [Acidimicrobiia bacterium]
ELFNAADREFQDPGTPGWHEASETTGEWTEPGFDLAQDTVLVFDGSGVLAGYQEAFTSPPHVRAIVWGKVHPDFRGIGLGAALLGWGEARAREMVGRAPDGAAVDAQAWIDADNAGATKLLEESGFSRSRFFWEMEIELVEAPIAQTWPEGLELRPFLRDKHHRPAHEAVRDSFKDHWGFADADPDEAFERAEHHLDANPNFDPKYFHVLWDGDEVAAVSLCYPNADNDPRKGLVGVLGVRRAWRQRGLGLAILLHSFRVFWDNNIPIVALGVDADSLTGATRLYEKAGMHVHKTMATFEKRLREGIDLRNRG